MIQIIFISAGVLLLLVIGLSVISRYRMCPPDKILVVYGKIGGQNAARCSNGGSTFVLPIFQNYDYLDLTPITIDIPLKNALSSQNIRVHTPANFTVAISNQPELMGNAATRLLGKSNEEIAKLAEEIITGQMRVVIASMTIEEINKDRQKLIQFITDGVEVELKKIGLHMINCNIRDISDDSGYIEALGKEAAAKAINDAQIRVAEENQRGASGRAMAERDQTIAVAEAKAAAATGSNKAEQDIVSSLADLAAKRADADGRVEAAQKTAKAQAEKAGYEAQRLSEDARALRDESSSKADQVAKANATKERVRVDAEAEAIRARTIAEGQASAARSIAAGEADAVKLRAEAEAAAIAMKLKAEAEGKKAILDAQAEGLRGFTNVTDAVQLILAQQLVQVATVQAGAIANLKMDKVVLMGGGGNGATPGSFVQDLYRQILPMHEIARQAGVNLPAFMGAPTESVATATHVTTVPAPEVFTQTPPTTKA